MRTITFVVAVFVLAELHPAARADAIWDVKIAEGAIAALQHGQNVNITFSYEVTNPGGVRIWARPITADTLTPNYAAHGSPLYPVGTGTSSAWFTITTGDVTVDRVRFEVWDDRQTLLLCRFYVPVTFTFSPHALHSISLDRISPSTVQFNQNVNSAFSYATSQAGGVRIWMRPFTNGALTPNYIAHGSPLYPAGSGTDAGFFTIAAGTTDVDSVRFQMWNDAQTVLLVELFIPTSYLFSPHEISNIVFTPSTPDGLLNGEDVSATFDYRTVEPGGARIFMRPFTDGALTPSYSAHPSPLYATGNGAGTGSFSIVTGETTVDSARFLMVNDAQTATLLEFFVPVNYHYAAHKVHNLQFLPPSPAYFSNNHRASLGFDYATAEAGGALIFPRPFTQGAFSPSYVASPSPLYPTGNGPGSGWYTITSGEVHVDQTRVFMTNSGQSSTLIEWYLPVSYCFGAQTLVGVEYEGGDIPLAFGLHQNFPNPFNPSTTILYDVPVASHLSLKVFNALGQEISTLADGPEMRGRHRVQFDGSRLPSGVYFVRLLAEGYRETRRLVLLR